VDSEQRDVISEDYIVPLTTASDGERTRQLLLRSTKPNAYCKWWLAAIHPLSVFGLYMSQMRILTNSHYMCVKWVLPLISDINQLILCMLLLTRDCSKTCNGD